MGGGTRVGVIRQKKNARPKFKGVKNYIELNA